ncbi:hypothetical protein OUZ56_030672 [Daphnia magna]|uniref:Uncharacterized protein n=1 Tax=Daphnia magna TaxID=35525 RepID=A0ABQ9ZSE8_9CRUS|nr:hypothetical protein OUZ56_030672 [Daphnia magna]
MERHPSPFSFFLFKKQKTKEFSARGMAVCVLPSANEVEKNLLVLVIQTIIVTAVSHWTHVQKFRPGLSRDPGFPKRIEVLYRFIYTFVLAPDQCNYKSLASCNSIEQFPSSGRASDYEVALYQN